MESGSAFIHLALLHPFPYVSNVTLFSYKATVTLNLPFPVISLTKSWVESLYHQARLLNLPLGSSLFVTFLYWILHLASLLI